MNVNMFRFLVLILFTIVLVHTFISLSSSTISLFLIFSQARIPFCFRLDESVLNLVSFAYLAMVVRVLHPHGQQVVDHCGDAVGG